MPKHFQLLLALTIFPLLAEAQPGAGLTRVHCAGADPSVQRVQVYVTASIHVGGQPVTVSTPVCATLGANLRLVNTGGVFTLEAVVPAPQPPILPKGAVERLTLPATIPSTQETYDVTLPKTPVLGSLVAIYLLSTMAGNDTLDFLVADGTKVIRLNLPRYRPFNGDKVVIGYQTLE